MRGTIIASTIAAVAILTGNGSTWAQTGVEPGRFALAPSKFPHGSHVVTSHIEPNYLLEPDRVLHFGRSFAKEGRLTGFFMEAVEGNRHLPQVDTSYLVSIFGAPHEAASAFEQQRYYWDALAQRRGGYLPLKDGQYGDSRAEGLYTFQSFDGWTLTELLFQRGPIFVEVFEELRIPHPSKADVRSFWTIATKLDDLARAASVLPASP